MSFAEECYQRLLDAQHATALMTPEQRRHFDEELDAERERQSKRIRINRKLPKAY